MDIIARLNRLPLWPYSYWALFSLGASYFFSILDTNMLGYVLPVIEKQFAISAKQASWAISSGLAGYIFGAFLIGRFSDIFGRRKALFITISFFTLGSIGCAISHNLTSLVIWRFITGLGLGSETAVITTLFSEITPDRSRGKYISIAVGLGLLGNIALPWLSYLLVPHYSWGWRCLFLFSAIFGVIILFSRFSVPESLTWLLSQNRVKEAENIIENAEMRMQKHGIVLTAPRDVSIELPKKFSFKDIFTRDEFPYIALFFSIWFLYYFGLYAWNMLSACLLVDVGFSLKTAVKNLGDASFGYLIGALIAFKFSDRFQKKYFVFTMLIFLCLALEAIGFFPSSAVVVIAGFLIAVSVGTLPIFYLYTANHFSVSVRNTCVAMTDGFGHLGGVICGQIILSLYTFFQSSNHWGFLAAFSTMSLSILIASILVLLGKKNA